MLPRDIDNRADVMLIADERLRTLLAFYRPVGGPGYALSQLCVCVCVCVCANDNCRTKWFFWHS